MGKKTGEVGIDAIQRREREARRAESAKLSTNINAWWKLTNEQRFEALQKLEAEDQARRNR